MRLSAVAALMIITTVLFSACAQKQMAQVDDRATAFYGRSSANFASNSNSGFVPTPGMVSYQSSANMDSVSSNDLAPPSQISSAPVAQPARTMTVGNWQWPVEGKVTQAFGKQANGIASEGITIAARAGLPIHAAQDGEVVFIGSQLRDYGNMVILRHTNGDMSSYAHAQEIIVAKGDTIRQGDVLGFVGKTGNVAEPQLHFAIRSGDRAVDPLSKLPSQLASR